MKSKLYFIGTLFLAIAYFLDVFIGMFMIQREYTISDDNQSTKGKTFNGELRMT